MELRPYCESDQAACEPWFADDEPFMPERWLAFAVAAIKSRPECHFLFVGCDDQEPVSVVSVSRVPADNRAVVSIMVAPDQRRRGVASDTLAAVRDEFADVDEFIAYVDRENSASIAMVESLGMVATPYKDPDREVLVWRRDGTFPSDDWQPPTLPLR